MKYIVCNKPGHLEFKEGPAPVRVKGEAMLKVKKVGICGTDLHAYMGNQSFFTYPRILGHELAAVVEEIDTNDRGINVGDKVVIVPYLNCKTCIACKKGKTNCCVDIKVLGVHIDGGMQEKISIPSDLLIPANNLSENEIAIVEPLAIGAHAIRRAQLEPGETIVVVGCGPIGIGIMRLAQIAGAKVVAIDVNRQRLEFVKEVIGVDLIVNAANNPVEEIAAFTNGDMATAVFDATGHKDALESGPNYMAHGGRYVLVGHNKGELTFMHPVIHAKETSLLCSRNATIEDFEHVMAILEGGKFPTDSFITHNVDCTDVVSDFTSWLDPRNNVIKVMVKF